MPYTVPVHTRIGHVHLKVSDLDKSLAFYNKLLGFAIMQRFGNSAAFISAGDYHHHIGLNTWQSKNGTPAPSNCTGLYHTAILYPTKKDLAAIVKRLQDAGYPLTGAANHGVSLAVYLNDPDENGVELYWDLPREAWPLDADGNLQMVTEPLDWEDLMDTIK
jgi:catechol 2,3-dioxygenase